MEATLEKPAEQATSAAKSAITLNHLQHALRVVGAAIQSRTIIPILQGVRIEQLPTGLAVEATSLDVYIRALVPESNGPEKALVIPADKFTAWTKLLDGEGVTISTTSTRSTVKCGRSRAVLPIMPDANWPDNSIYGLKGDGITLKQSDLARALRFAMIAVCEDASRFTLNGIKLEGNGETLKLIATNGHCMMVYSMPCAEKIDLLLPSILIKALLPLLDGNDEGIDVNYDANRILASVSAETLVFIGSPKMNGQFPNWQACLPNDKRVEITVNAKDMLSSLERCALLSDERSGLVILNFGEQIVLSSASALNGESQETVDCVGAPKEPLQIGINSEYLINLTKKLDGEMQIALPANHQKPLLFKATPHDGEQLSYIIMPMRV